MLLVDSGDGMMKTNVAREPNQHVRQALAGAALKRSVDMIPVLVARPVYADLTPWTLSIEC